MNIDKDIYFCEQDNGLNNEKNQILNENDIGTKYKKSYNVAEEYDNDRGTIYIINKDSIRVDIPTYK